MGGDGYHGSNTTQPSAAGLTRIHPASGAETRFRRSRRIDQVRPAADRHLNDFDAHLEKSPDYQKEDLFEWALRMTKPFLNDTLNLTLAASSFGLEGDDGGFQRFTAEYELTDSIELTGGVVLYQSGGLQRTRGIDDNDRVYFEIQYHF